jgi:hypothetical protein
MTHVTYDIWVVKSATLLTLTRVIAMSHGMTRHMQSVASERGYTLDFTIY